MQRLLAIALVLLAAPTHAETLYRCVTGNGAVSYQSHPCSASARLDRVLEYRPDPVANVERAPARPSSIRRPPRRSMRIVARRQPATAADRCRAGRAKRDAALQRLGLKRTYAQLSALDAEARAACGD